MPELHESDQAIERAVNYVSGFDPGFPQRLVGASAEQVELLEGLVGHQLPSIYRAFLSRMGQNHGGLNIAFDGTTNIDRVLRYYQNGRAYGDLQLSSDVVMIGLGGQADRVGLQELKSAEPQVVFIDRDDEVTGVYASSLPVLLFQTAFDKYRWRAYPHTAFYTSSYQSAGGRSRMAEAERIARVLGFVPAWFSDSQRLCAERQDAVVSVTQFPEQGPLLKVSGNTADEAQKLGSAFADVLGLRFVKWLK